MRSFVLPLCFLGICLLGPGDNAQATVLRGIDLQGLCDQSDHIIRGQVVDLAPQWRAGRIRTAVTLRVAASLFGGAVSGDRVTFWTLGGEVGGIGQRVVGTARFYRGEQVIVFLQRRAGVLVVSGMVQGKVMVLGARAPGEPAMVASAVGGFGLSGGAHPLRATTTLAVFESQVLARLRTRGRAQGRQTPVRHP